MDSFVHTVVDYIPWLKIMGSLALILVLSSIRLLFNKTIRGKKEVISKSQRIWITRIKNIFWVILFISLIFIWAPQLQTIALSLAAVAVAVVIATKEMILCIVGSFVRVSARPFELGDWVRVDGIVGEVVNSNLFSFEIQEFDRSHGTYEYTGTYHIIPNSKILTTNISNENIFKNMLGLEFCITLPETHLSINELMDALHHIIDEEVQPFKERILKQMKAEKRKTGLALQDSVFLIALETTEFGFTQFWIRVFTPVNMALSVKNNIMSKFMSISLVHDSSKKTFEEYKLYKQNSASKE
ncbi:MAG: hypothetical protein CMP22_01930 [Rickettsiales bacterium]|nr:hypothetical protein [Rickettsiales bacterium]|tara:strand:- start:702 stop:1598 length:897 start_codon:yes stop_codon:yes gene_type:complete